MNELGEFFYSNWDGNEVGEITQVDGEGSPLGWTGVEVVVIDVEVARADRLRSETVEQGHLRSAGDAN